MMNTKCQDCEKGPEGPGGHDNLFSHAFFGGEVVMKCRKCGTFWSRRVSGAHVTWSEAKATDGSLLPSGND